MVERHPIWSAFCWSQVWAVSRPCWRKWQSKSQSGWNWVGAEPRHPVVVADPMHEHAAMLFLVELVVVDQLGREGDRAHLPHQR